MSRLQGNLKTTLMVERGDRLDRRRIHWLGRVDPTFLGRDVWHLARGCLLLLPVRTIVVSA